ncbi:MAG: restriction endonuclease [Candidatus Cloacimonetes bacterium]|nr:restriction endonuclease [Candidatus Cloacimonadota bacterium]
MTNKTKELSRSRALAAKTIYAALTILKENDGEMPGKELIDKVGNKITLSDWDRERYEKTGYIRWQSILHFFSIDCVKAGFLLKKKRIWYLTKEGEDALKLGEVELLNAATEGYKKWREKNPKIKQVEPDIKTDEEIAELSDKTTLDQIEQLAIDSIQQQIKSLNPYEFQDLAAALLRGMGYFTPHVSPRGKDGGVDIIVYRDPLGTVTPRIKVQVKHREQSATVHELRQLMGLLQKDGDMGIFISTGGFTPDSKTTARGAHVHVELIDLDRFINLWQEFYPKLSDEDKAQLPLLPFYFYAPNE